MGVRAGQGGSAAPGSLGWARLRPLCALPQRYLDEAEREKQQYMKELREYQQSEAYKMCTEKIQEKKIKKGGLWEQWLPGSSQVLSEPFGDMRPAPGVTSFLPCRGRGRRGREHPTQRAPAQGKALSGLPVCGETEAHATAALAAGVGGQRVFWGCESQVPGGMGGRA